MAVAAATPKGEQGPLDLVDVDVLLEREPLSPPPERRKKATGNEDHHFFAPPCKRMCGCDRPLTRLASDGSAGLIESCGVQPSGFGGGSSSAYLRENFLHALHEQQTLVLAEIRKGHDLQQDVLQRLDQLGQRRGLGSEPLRKSMLPMPVREIPRGRSNSQTGVVEAVVSDASSQKPTHLDRNVAAMRRAMDMVHKTVSDTCEAAMRKTEITGRGTKIRGTDLRDTEIDPDRAGDQDDGEDNLKRRVARSSTAVTRVHASMIARGVGPASKYNWMARASSVMSSSAGQEASGNRPNLIVWLVTHPMFDVVSALLIISSTIMAGVETDHMARYKTSHPDMQQCNMIINYAFAIEWFLRLCAYRLRFFTDKDDRSWNLFDSCMVLLGAFEMLSGTEGHLSNVRSSSRIVRIVRLLRLLKCVRLGRIVRYAHTFRQIVYSLKSSAKTLVWAIAIVFLLVYVFAIVFCQAATDHNLESAPMISPDLEMYYGNLPAALYTLYKTFTGGQSWGEVLVPLMCLHWTFVALFLFFVTVIFFGVLNVVAAIFVDSALQSQAHHKELLMQDKVFKKNLYRDHLKEVFMAIDEDGSGCINMDEMEFFLSDPKLALYLESIDIYPHDARALFRLLDMDASGEISIDEFCEGCMRLQGEAKSFDIHCMIYNNAVLTQRIQQILDTLQEFSLSGRASKRCSWRASGRVAAEDNAQLQEPLE